MSLSAAAETSPWAAAEPSPWEWWKRHLGSGGNVTLAVAAPSRWAAGGNVTLGSGGTVTLGSGGTCSQRRIHSGAGGSYTFTGSGGTVTLGSGGNVTLGSGGNVTLGSGGTIALGSGGNVTLGSGGNVTLGSGGTITLGSGGNVTLGSGGTVTLGSGGNVTLGSGGVVALGSGGNVALGSGGTIALGSGGNVTLGSGGATTNELDYDTANSVVRPPSSPTETPQSTSPGAPVVVNWTAPAFGVVATYTISRSSDGATPIVIGSVSGVGGNPPATTFTDTNPDPTAQTVVYTIATTLLPVPIDPSPGQSAPSPPAVLTNNQTIVLGPPALPSSVSISTSPLTVYATAESNGVANGLAGELQRIARRDPAPSPASRPRTATAFPRPAWPSTAREAAPSPHRSRARTCRNRAIPPTTTPPILCQEHSRSCLRVPTRNRKRSTSRNCRMCNMAARSH